MEALDKKEKWGIREIASIALMAAVCCILGPLSIPIGPIPLSLQVLAVYLCVFALGRKRGTVAVIVYILLGFVGMPVFSGYSGGAAKLLGPTGGFILGFLFLAWISGTFIDRFTGIFETEKKIGDIMMQVVGMVLGLAVCYLFGCIWFMLSQHTDFIAAFSVCVLPFLLADLIKIAISLTAGNAVRAGLKKAGLFE